jgi:hypothetical protein
MVDNNIHMRALQVQKQNKEICKTGKLLNSDVSRWKIGKLLVSSNKSRCYILANVGTFNDNLLQNKIPPWLLPCKCGKQRRHFHARFKSEAVCIRGFPYYNEPPQQPISEIII